MTSAHITNGPFSVSTQMHREFSKVFMLEEALKYQSVSLGGLNCSLHGQKVKNIKHNAKNILFYIYFYMIVILYLHIHIDGWMDGLHFTCSAARPGR